MRKQIFIGSLCALAGVLVACSQTQRIKAVNDLEGLLREKPVSLNLQDPNIDFANPSLTQLKTWQADCKKTSMCNITTNSNFFNRGKLGNYKQVANYTLVDNTGSSMTCFTLNTKEGKKFVGILPKELQSGGKVNIYRVGCSSNPVDRYIPVSKFTDSTTN